MASRFQVWPESRGRRVYYFVILAVCAVLAYLLLVLDLRFFLVPSHSMVPTLAPPEYILTLRPASYQRGDVVVLEDPGDPGGYLVKRIVGVPGDTVDIRGGGLFLNGFYASEPYVKEPIEYGIEPYVVPRDSVFVLGDNRNESVDSHNWGNGPAAVEMGSLIGKVRYVYLPLKRARKVGHYPLTNVTGK